MASGNRLQIMTLANSIIGVSILAMPFCYKQCGIVLATLVLAFCSMFTRLACHYLMKSALVTKRRNFEFLAFHVFGRTGKTAVEICIIMLMIGTCVAFFVVIGDLGPAIVGSALNTKNFAALRQSFLIAITAFVVLPLGLLKNVDSLSSVCAASFAFYLCLIFKVFIEGTDNLVSGNWMQEVHYWRPSGLLRCLPIFSMALSCQTQLFEIYDSMSTGASLNRMDSIVKTAVNLCTVLYIGVGFFGYIAFYNRPLTGNVLMSFSRSIFSELITLGFVLSLAVTFPLVIFPCRASVYSLLFKKVHAPHYELVTGGGNRIPETQFKCITVFIVTISLVTGMLASNIEVVLGLLGSTVGVSICYLFPPLLFTKAASFKDKTLGAKISCFFGLFIMIMGTYANVMNRSEGVSRAQIQPGNFQMGSKPLEEKFQILEGKDLVEDKSKWRDQLEEKFKGKYQIEDKFKGNDQPEEKFKMKDQLESKLKDEKVVNQFKLGMRPILQNVQEKMPKNSSSGDKRQEPSIRVASEIPIPKSLKKEIISVVDKEIPVKSERDKRIKNGVNLPEMKVSDLKVKNDEESKGNEGSKGIGDLKGAEDFKMNSKSNVSAENSKAKQELVGGKGPDLKGKSEGNPQKGGILTQREKRDLLGEEKDGAAPADGKEEKEEACSKIEKKENSTGNLIVTPAKLSNLQPVLTNLEDAMKMDAAANMVHGGESNFGRELKSVGERKSDENL